MNHTTIPIRNMHCASCELIIEKALLSVPGVHRAQVNLRRAEAIITHTAAVDANSIQHAIEDAGYAVGSNERKLWYTRDADAYGELAIGALVLLAAYVILSRTGLLQLSMANATGTGLGSSLIIGLTAGISTCMALVGGLVLGVAARHAEKHPEATSLQKFRPHIFFNVGRIGGFFVLGGLLGSVGGLLSPSAVVLGIVTMLVAIVMVLLGVQLTEIFPRISGYTLTLPSNVSRALGISRHHTKEYSHQGAATLGALTFFLPCGFTQLMQMNAIASSSFLAGGMIMASFAIGTAPGLLGIGGLTAIVHGSAAKIFFKAAGLLVVAFAVFNLANGYRLTGWEPFWEGRQSPPATDTAIPIEKGVQVARMRQTAAGYEPNHFVIRTNVPLRWVVEATDPNSCSGGISVPSLSILQYFTQGENVIEFTPTHEGEIRFTCPMGMFPGSFTVVN